MGVIVLDGPEKAGKTTLARALMALDPTIRYRKWGPISEHGEYAKPLLLDVGDEYHLTIWDRSWASEHVYSVLLQRGRALGADPWLGEWLYSRPVLSNGMLVMVLPSDPADLIRRRDHTDLNVNPALELSRFRQYAETFGWIQVPDASDATRLLRQARFALSAGGRRHVPEWAGPSDAPVVFVGEQRNLNSDYWWCPFATPNPTLYGRALGVDAMRCAWTNTDANPTWLKHGQQVIACGGSAHTWCYHNHIDCMAVPHPSYLYRWGRARAEIAGVERDIVQVVKEALGVKVP